MDTDNTSEFNFDDEEFEFISPDEVEVSRRGAEKTFNEGLLNALQWAASTGEALRVKSMQTMREDFASQADFSNQKQKHAQEIRKHFTELQTRGVIAEGSSLKIDWAQSSGIPQARVRG
tara:strand:+ start:1481 stop:1837 length:357 start_codon:yes stop_codon:yes gene_type:complete